MPALLFLRGEKKEINVVEAAAFACPSFSDEPSMASSPADRRWTSPSGGVGSKQRRNSPGRGLCFSMDAEGNSPCPWWRRRRWHVVFAAGAQWFLRNLSASLAQSPCSCMSSPGNLDRSVVVTWFLLASRMACMGLEFWICAGHGVLLAKAGTGQQHISKTEIFFFL